MQLGDETETRGDGGERNADRLAEQKTMTGERKGNGREKRRNPPEMS